MKLEIVLRIHDGQNLYNFDVKSSMFQYMTRCWSFDTNLLLNIIRTYDKMKTDILYASRTEKQADIEHLLYRHLSKKSVSHINIMGIEGYFTSMS